MQNKRFMVVCGTSIALSISGAHGGALDYVSQFREVRTAPFLLDGSPLGGYEEVLVEGRKRGKWQGRTRTHKLVFFEDEAYHQGEMVTVKIERSSPWSLQGSLAVEAKLLNPVKNRGDD